MAPTTKKAQKAARRQQGEADEAPARKKVKTEVPEEAPARKKVKEEVKEEAPARKKVKEEVKEEAPASVFGAGLFGASPQGSVSALLSGGAVKEEEAGKEESSLTSTFGRLFSGCTAPPPPSFAATAAAQRKVREAKEEKKKEEEAKEAAKGGKKAKMSKEEEEARKDRTVFIGNVPLKWDEKLLRKTLRAAVGDKYAGAMKPIWFRDEPVAEKWQTKKLRKAGHIQKEYSDQASDAKTAYVVVESGEAVDVVRAAAHGLVADSQHVLRADGVGAKAKLQTLDRKRSVFVGNLPGNTTEDDLRQVFAEAGDISAVRVVRDKVKKQCKGIAFVMFKDRKSVKVALQYWGATLKEREIRVTKVESRDGQDEEEDEERHPAQMRIQDKKAKFRKKVQAKTREGLKNAGLIGKRKKSKKASGGAGGAKKKFFKKSGNKAGKKAGKAGKKK